MGDVAYGNKFQLETLIGRLAGIFSGLAIFMSCLGLFGLAAFTAEQRTKEIGVRKVLGASVLSIWKLLSTDFLLWIGVSRVIATPVAYYFLQGWLKDDQYHVPIGTMPFVLSPAIAIGITVLTISFQAVRAAMADPVKSLGAE